MKHPPPTTTFSGGAHLLAGVAVDVAFLSSQLLFLPDIDRIDLWATREPLSRMVQLHGRPLPLHGVYEGSYSSADTHRELVNWIAMVVCMEKDEHV